MTEKDNKEKILTALEMKSLVKQKVYDQTQHVFGLLKEILQEITDEYNEEIHVKDPRVGFEYKERSQFEIELKVAGDLLIFSMHSNIFEFDRNHNVWKLNYIKENSLFSFCGIINVYNFLADSFKYNRLEDLGYLISRIFVNIEKHFFVEGKRQQEYQYNNFRDLVISKDKLKDIVLRIIIYALDFDLLVPPYDNVKIASVGQLNEKVQYHKMKTGKRLGYKFNSDDVS